MKQIIKVEKVYFSHYQGSNKSEQSPYIRLEGVDGQGGKVKALAFENVAAVLDKEIDNRLAPGEDISDSSVFLELSGEMMKSTTDKDGRKTKPFFRAKSFIFLSGPALEVRKMRHEALSISKKVEEIANTGELSEAVRTSLEYINKVAAPLVKHSELSSKANHESAVNNNQINQNAEAAQKENNNSVPEQGDSGVSPEEKASERLNKTDDNKTFSANLSPEDKAERVLDGVKPQSTAGTAGLSLNKKTPIPARVETKNQDHNEKENNEERNSTPPPSTQKASSSQRMPKRSAFSGLRPGR